MQQAVQHLFTTFTATGSATATVKAFTAGQLKFPRRITAGSRRGEQVWGPLEHSQVLRVLHNPRYAGAFSYGRHATGRSATGRPTSRVLPRDQWTVLITDAHPGYISWEQFETHQARLTELATARGGDRMASPPREGPALLQGLVICGVCGRRMTVRYHTRRGTQFPDYVCQVEGIRTATPVCQNVPGASIDTAVDQLLLTKLNPLALETALTVAEELAARAEDADRLRAATVQRAQYHADLARRRYLAVDPANRLVADSLEADWNNTLRELTEATDDYERAKTSAGALTDQQRQRVTALAADIPTLWTSPATPARERKRLVRLLLQDATISRTDHNITVHIRLRGGQDHTLTLPLPLSCWQLRKTPEHVLAAINNLTDEHTDSETAKILEQRGLTSGTGQPIHARLVRQIRKAHHIPSHTQRLRDQGLLTLNEIARQLDVTPKTVKTWRNQGLLTGRRANDKDEYLYQLPDPNLPRPRIGRPPRNPDTTSETTPASHGRSAV